MSDRRGAAGGCRWRADDERGAALVLALAVLVGLTALALALLSIGALEPQISRNHVDMLRARYLAEAGIEYALAALASSVGSWSIHLAGATCAIGVRLPATTLPGLPRELGEFAVRIRNDCEPGDDRVTGVPPEPVTNATSDTNGTVIVAATGGVGPATHTVTVVVSAETGSTPGVGQSVAQILIRTHNWADQ